MRIQYKCHESFKHFQNVYVIVQINVYSQQTRNLITLYIVLVFSLLDRLVLARNSMSIGDDHDHEYFKQHAT